MRKLLLLVLLAVPVRAQKTTALRDLSASLEALSQEVGRAVVQIFSTGYALNEEGDGGTSSPIARQRSTGSGALVSADGYIVTNAHVVSGARQVRVQLIAAPPADSGHHSILRAAGKLYDAKVVGVDRDTDVAVVKIEGTGLPFLRFGDSERLLQGQLVMAFGNPLGLQNSVSMGVVSSVARQLKPDDPMIYIQTDASINPGNSGGPLVDAEGRVMGLNTFILSQSGGSEGIGFAVPSNIVRTIYNQIRKSGRVHRSQIGVYVQTIAPILAEGLRLSQDWGVLVGDVYPDGPAAAAGLHVGDIILTMNGKRMENARQLEVNLYSIAAGEKARLEVLRGKDKLDVEVPVAEEEDETQRFADLVDPEKNLVPRLGILGIPIDREVAAMLPDLRKKYGIVVAARAPEAPVATGLQPGDVIYSVNGEPVSSIDALRTALKGLKTGSSVVLQIEREGKLRFLAFALD